MEKVDSSGLERRLFKQDLIKLLLTHGGYPVDVSSILHKVNALVDDVYPHLRNDLASGTLERKT